MNIFTRIANCGRLVCSCKDQRLLNGFHSTTRAPAVAPLQQSDSKEKRRRRNELFDAEQRRQKERVGRIEKMAVCYKGVPEDVELVMNRGMSTPHDVAQHISEFVAGRAMVALVDGSTLWDVHRPLHGDCSVQLLHFDDKEPYHVNKAFWRTCAFLLGAVADNAFKDGVPVTLHSFPPPNVKSGSFVYDVKIGLDGWRPSRDELRTLSAEFVSLARKELPLERLEVTAEVAADIFADNAFKVEQIPDIASSNPGNSVVMYRAGDHIDISRGPMVANSGFVGRATVAAVHQVDTDVGAVYRFQGVSLPKGIMLNHFAYGIIEERARKLNNGRLPGQSEHYFTPPGSETEMSS